MSAPLLAVENLCTHFFTRAGLVKAVDGASFTVERGRILGLVGESGSSKSMTGYSILGLIDAPGRIVSGRIVYNTALLWITHDLSVVAGLADDVCVMYAGRIVEPGAVAEILDRPMHPYTRGLLDSVPSRNTRGQPLRQIPGMTPSLADLPAGCAFRERCDFATERCAQSPGLTEPAPGRRLRCFHPLNAA